MEYGVQGLLAGSDIHGFHTLEDLDVKTVMDEAKTRWLRPNEIHAFLCNYKYFTVHVRPVNLPKGGTVILFDRKKLRNFRKDGHNWKKKKDGKTVKEAHEHLKVGNEERIHVYYAHGEDNPTFVRRCYWLLDKTLEHIVLVHYRETQEVQSSPATPSSALSDLSPPWVLTEGSESPIDCANYNRPLASLEPNDNMRIQNHRQTLHAINTLEWDELLGPDDPNKSRSAKASVGQQQQYETNGFGLNGANLSADELAVGSLENLPGQMSISNSINFNIPNDVVPQTLNAQMTSYSQRIDFDNPSKDGLQSQDSFGKWMNYMIAADSPGSVDDPSLEPATGYQSFPSPSLDNNSSAQEHIFNITDVSPAWAFSTEETKILVIGHFLGGQSQLAISNLFCVCGDARVPAEVIQSGVYRCLLSPQTPGLVNLYLSFDGYNPISQVITFEFRAPEIPKSTSTPSVVKPHWEELRAQMRLAHLLFATPKSLNILSSKIPQDAQKGAKIFAHKCSHITSNWTHLTKSIDNNQLSFPQAKDQLFELSLHTKLQEWLLERILEGCKIPERDEQGQSVIHLCAILGYTWAIYPYKWSGLSLDYRDKFGWTALHWAAYYGREKMVAVLLSAGAKPSMVTDPTTGNPSGCTAADLASKNGYEGLGAYLAEKALVAQFNEMTLAGNASGSLQPASDSGNYGNTAEDMELKDTLAAYRTAADAAARIQSAFREHSFKLRKMQVESSTPESEARSIIAAMKIQHAFRKYDTRKKIDAAARIQYRFRTWKIRKDFLNMRRQATKIQSIFRGYQVRRQYRKIVWSVGVLEKAILRWRLKRKGFRGLQVAETTDTTENQKQDNDVVDEDFFRASRKQAEERVERAVVRVQAMFRSKKAQEEYRRMKLEHNTASLQYEEFLDPTDTYMG
ncbi:PREDICTED: calmodulin-binding transcription activator 5 isoform X2 [Ipomoea nil]|uniref:calmodulin-binding transcription activator 5 isoform X2 n=1 Tax=Ipomoea nil TaxID=35883 RepID=UPI0009019563|nr:PREDICTED: calmodulin-binding transcription activator 5 isoform X2 [Ipomoea nil]